MKTSILFDCFCRRRGRGSMGSPRVLLVFTFYAFLLSQALAWKASCKDPYYGRCYGVPLACPVGCPRLCEVDCKLCKPYCACDKPGAVCQDPRFIGGDGITFYFHGKKDKDFCLVSDSKIHINGHFIGKTSPKQTRDFTWVQAIGLIFGSHHLYLGAQKASRWDDSIDHISLSLNGEDIEIPTLFGATHIHKDAGLKIWRLEDTNSVIVNAKDQFKIKARVLPITQEDSRTHGYEITNEDCFSHLEVNFRFYNLSTKVDGVLGQTYAPGYQSRVLVGAAMPIMGGARRFESSHIFSTDCLASKFEEEIGDMGKWKLE